MHLIRMFLGSVLTACALAAAAHPSAADEGGAAGPADQDSASTPSHTWIGGLKAGIRRAQAERKPLLVFAGSDTCPWCRRLEAELAAEPLARELNVWILAYVDVDRRPADARELGIGPVPALRILNVRGIRVASLEGLTSPDELTGWLRKHYEEATKGVDHTLLESGEPNVLAIVRLVRQLDQRDPTQREAAVKRLTANRKQAAPAVLRAFREGNLAVRLTVLEILQQWRAPIDGLDPWRPETITPERLAKLDQWRDSPTAAPAKPAQKLTEDNLAQAREQIDRLLNSDGVSAAAIRGRLTRFGSALLPEVYERLKNTDNDQQREGLLALRYRLVASDSLIVRWPGGIVRLASADVDQRRRAAEQLAELATAEDQALLLELFSDPDSLIRELSLRSLEHLGGKAARASLARLLNDPEPNVRAAVLKRLAEDAPAAMVSQVVEYVKHEQDPDLLVHAIRYFKATPRAKSLQALLPLLKHESWQVRAEAAEAVGSAADDLDPDSSIGNSTAHLAADAYAALIDLLADADPFVVSRAVEGLGGADMVIAVEPLVNAALTHTDLAPQIVEVLSHGENMEAKALPHVKKFRSHEVPEIRAAAVTGLFQMTPGTIAEWIVPGLRDESKTVRMAAAEVVSEALDDVRHAERRKIVEQQLGRDRSLFGDPFARRPVIVRESLATRALKTLLGGLGKKTEDTEKKEPSADESEDEPVPPKQPVDESGRTTEPSDTATAGGNGDNKEETGDDDTVANDAGRQWDRWLAKFQAGGKRPEWTNEIVEPLTDMLCAVDPAERAAAAGVLVALGYQETALPILREIAAAQPHLSDSFANVLPWLVWQEREPLFDQMMSDARSDDDRKRIVMSMSQVLDPRTAARFWSLLEAPELSQDMAQTLDNALTLVYFGESYYSDDMANATVRREIIAAARPRTESGSELQRLVALVKLAQVDAKQAGPVARQIADDQTLGPELRRDAFQVLLAVSARRERQQMAAAAMAGEDVTRQLVAIRFLVKGDDGLRYLHGYTFRVQVTDRQSTSYRSGTPIIPAAPKAVRREVVLPLLEHEDLEIRAYAAYLLALLEDPQGLPVLIEYWRQRPDDDGRMKLVYRAIAVLDDPNYLPVLREIYTKLERYYVQEFYWTIRIMSGPEILDFRRQIREKTGLDNLR